MSLEINDQVLVFPEAPVRRRGRPRGNPRPLSQQEKRRRNAEYERERRALAAENMDLLKAILGLSRKTKSETLVVEAERVINKLKDEDYAHSRKKKKLTSKNKKLKAQLKRLRKEVAEMQTSTDSSQDSTSTPLADLDAPNTLIPDIRPLSDLEAPNTLIPDIRPLSEMTSTDLVLLGMEPITLELDSLAFPEPSFPMQLPVTITPSPPIAQSALPSSPSKTMLSSTSPIFHYQPRGMFTPSPTLTASPDGLINDYIGEESYQDIPQLDDIMIKDNHHDFGRIDYYQKCEELDSFMSGNIELIEDSTFKEFLENEDFSLFDDLIQ